MATFSIKGTFDGKELVQGFKDVKEQVEGVENAGHSAKVSLDKMLQQKNSTTNYKRQLSQITAELTDLSVNFSKLTEAERQTDFGKAMAARIDELTMKAQDLKGVMDNVTSTIKGADINPPDFGDHWAEVQRQSEQTYAKFEGVQKVSAGVASGFAAIQGAAALLGDENEDLQKALLKVQAAMAIAQGIGGIKDLLEGLKQLKAAFTFTSAATTASTVATQANTTATVTNTAALGAATVAQKTFNKACNANPFILLASAIIAVGTALFAFCGKSEDAKKVQEEYNKKVKEAEERERSRRDTVNSTVGDILVKYRLLQYEWKQLTTTQEKNDWITNNKDKFNELGLSINSITSAQDAFITKSDQVKDALIAQAEAAALATVYQEAFTDVYKRNKELDHQDPILPGYEPSKEDAKLAGLMSEDYETYTYTQSSTYGSTGTTSTTTLSTVNEKGAAKLEELRKQRVKEEKEANNAEVQAILNDLLAKREAAEKAVEGIDDLVTDNKKTSSIDPINKDDIYDEDSLRAAQKELSVIQDKLNRMDINSPEFESTKQALHEAEKKVEDIQAMMKKPIKTDIGLTTEVETAEEKLVKFYDNASTEINNLIKQCKIGVIDLNTLMLKTGEINLSLMQKGLKPITLPEDVFTGVDIRSKRNDAQTRIDTALLLYEIGFTNADEAQSVIDAINKELTDLGLKEIYINIETERALQSLSAVQSVMDSLNSTAGIVSSINSVYDAIKRYPDAIAEAENGWERFMAGFEIGMQIMNVFTTILGTINTLLTTFNTIQTISTALKKKDAVASGEQAIADMAAAETSMTKGGAQMFEAATGAGKAVSWLPIVGPILAIAAIGAIMGVMLGAMSKSKFAAGGIVTNASKIGDFNIARVNGGEMILNNRQQANLFKMLDQNRMPNASTGTSEVSFRIQGDTLVGVIDNYNKKRGRI